MSDTPELSKAEQELKEIQEKEAAFVKAVKTAFTGLPGAPNEEAILQMKADHGEVFVSAIDDDLMFLFRSLTRLEYLNIRKQLSELAQKAQEGKAEIREGLFEENVVETCILWGSNPDVMQSKGGTVDMLFEQIMAHSNFVNAQTAVQMVIKL